MQLHLPLVLCLLLCPGLFTVAEEPARFIPRVLMSVRLRHDITAPDIMHLYGRVVERRQGYGVGGSHDSFSICDSLRTLEKLHKAIEDWFGEDAILQWKPAYASNVNARLRQDVTCRKIQRLKDFREHELLIGVSPPFNKTDMYVFAGSSTSLEWLRGAIEAECGKDAILEWSKLEDAPKRIASEVPIRFQVRHEITRKHIMALYQETVGASQVICVQGTQDNFTISDSPATLDRLRRLIEKQFGLDAILHWDRAYEVTVSVRVRSDVTIRKMWQLEGSELRNHVIIHELLPEVYVYSISGSSMAVNRLRSVIEAELGKDAIVEWEEQ